MTARTMRMIVRDFNSGYRPWRLCEMYAISPDMLVAVLLESKRFTNRGIAKAQVASGMRRKRV